MIKTEALRGLLSGCIIFASLAIAASAQDVPSRLCIRDTRLNLEVDTRALTYKAEVDGQSFNGVFGPVFWVPEFFYIAGIGNTPGFSFYTNISFLRHSSFADVRIGNQTFRAWNVEHLDCDGNPSTAPPFEVKITGELKGSPPFTPNLKAIPIDFENLSNYEWCVNGKMVAVGQSFSPTFTEPGRYTIEAEAIYNDIKASTEAEVVVEVEQTTPPPRPPNHPPTLAPGISGKLKKNRVIALTANASDPDGDTLDINWLCSDGLTATGAVVERIFKRGAFSCSCAASDGRGGAVAATIAFEIR